MIKNIFYICICVVLISCSKSKEVTSNIRPNILLIMSDDHAYQAISAYGHNLNKTPNIDRLAKEGAIFNKAFVTNSICAPSRAVMLTGKHSFVNGKVDNIQPFNWEQENFPKLLQKNGYETALIGKIHLKGTPTGFDHYAVLPGQGSYYNPDFNINGIKKRIKGYVTDITTQMALKWLKNRNTNKPFCLIYNQKAPHRRWLPSIEQAKKYTKKQFKEPGTLFDTYENRGKSAKTAEMTILNEMNLIRDNKIFPTTMESLGVTENIDFDKRFFNASVGRMDSIQRQSWDSIYQPINEEFEEKFSEMTKAELTKWKYQRYMQDYLATIASVDNGVGQVLDLLEELGLDKNTVVVYTSDQGFYLGEHGWFDKRFMYEESLRTPLLVKYPNEIKPNTQINQMVQNLDFAPTILDYAEVATPENMQGVSFRKLVQNNKSVKDWRDAIYYTYYEYPATHMVKRHYGIRTDRYKLIHFYYDVDEWELYDLEKDPKEMKNEYNNPEYEHIKLEMHKKLQETRKKYGDSDSNNTKILKNYLKVKNKNSK